MGIPRWVWPNHGSDPAGGSGFAPDRDGVEDASTLFEVLSDATRLEILTTLADHEHPMAYTRLRDETSIEDNGRLNYHLRQLTDEFVVQREAGYALTGRGEAAIDTVFEDESR
jgi:citrate synthase